MKNLIIFSFCLFLLNCKKTEDIKSEKNVQKIKLSGKASNCELDTIFIYGEANFFEKIALTNGDFSKELEIPYKGIVTFQAGTDSKFIYVEDGFDLNMIFDCKDFNQSFVFSGKGADENNFGMKKYQILVKNYGDFSEESNKKLYSLDEQKFLDIHEQYSKDMKQLISESNIKNEYFKKMELEDLKYHILSHSQTYEMFHGEYTNNNNFKVSDKFPKIDENFNYDQDIYLFSYSYKNLLNEHFFNSRHAKPLNQTERFISGIDLIKKAKGDVLKNKLIFDLGFELHPDLNDLDKNSQTLSDLTSDKNLKLAISEKIKKFKSISKGNMSPTFDYEDVNGNKVTLDELKGNYVYIDIWATWCGPCIAEAPHFNTIAQKFKNKNIHFVGISVDRAEDKALWQNAVKDKKLEGIQLLVDRKNMTFVDTFVIKGIPSFILISPEGKIINADAPRPSSTDLIKLFEELGI